MYDRGERCLPSPFGLLETLKLVKYVTLNHLPPAPPPPSQSVNLCEAKIHSYLQLVQIKSLAFLFSFSVSVLSNYLAFFYVPGALTMCPLQTFLFYLFTIENIQSLFLKHNFDYLNHKRNTSVYNSAVKSD